MKVVKHDVAEDVELLLYSDPPERVAQRLGRNPGTIARTLYRAGRPDLARKFNGLDWQERTASGYVRPRDRRVA